MLLPVPRVAEGMDMGGAERRREPLRRSVSGRSLSGVLLIDESRMIFISRTVRAHAQLTAAAKLTLPTHRVREAFPKSVQKALNSARHHLGMEHDRPFVRLISWGAITPHTVPFYSGHLGQVYMSYKVLHVGPNLA